MEQKHIEKWWFFLLCWVFQTFSWLGVIAYAIYYTFPEKELIIKSYQDKEEVWITLRTSLGHFCDAFMIIGPFSYFIYICLEWNSLTYKYLEEFNSNSTIKNKIEYWLTLKPDISIEWNCYHNEEYEYTETDSDGKEHKVSATERVSTDRGTYDFKYYSCRDISGKFTLESNSRLNSYVFLNLSSSVEFADEGTISDYNKEINRINSFRNKDTYFDLKKIETIKCLSENQIILINKCSSFFLNKCTFSLFTILCLVEFYKIFFYCMGSVKNFTVKKAVSTRKDLGDNEYSEKYYMQNPSIESPFVNIIYEPNMFIQIFPEYKTNNTNNDNKNNNSIISFEISEPKQSESFMNDNIAPLLDEELFE